MYSKPHTMRQMATHLIAHGFSLPTSSFLIFVMPTTTLLGCVAAPYILPTHSCPSLSIFLVQSLYMTLLLGHTPPPTPIWVLRGTERGDPQAVEALKAITAATVTATTAQ